MDFAPKNITPLQQWERPQRDRALIEGPGSINSECPRQGEKAEKKWFSHQEGKEDEN